MLLMGNGRVVTRDPGHPFWESGGVAIEGDTIREVGAWEEMKEKYPQAGVLDAKGGIIMPGFINTHEHIYSAMARGLSIHGYHPEGFLDVLEGMWWTIDRKLTPAQIRLSAAATYLDCIKNGVTTIFDHHAGYGCVRDSLFTIASAAREAGVRSCLCYEVSDRDGPAKRTEAVLENEAFARYAKKEESGMLAGMMGLHASFTLSDETLALCAEHRTEEEGCHIHVAEGIDDLYDSLRKYGKRILDRLMDFCILGPKTIAAHCIYINPHEMELLKATETMVVHNPESNMGNAVGCPPTMELVRRGILTGLGTDGYTHDMLESYKTANLLHKHNLCSPNAAWEEVPQMLFRNNPRIAGRYFKKPLGILKEGAAADVIAADYIPLTPMNESNADSHILFGMSGRCVTDTVINGRIRMKNREPVDLDEEKILYECRQEAEKLWNAING